MNSGTGKVKLMAEKYTSFLDSTQQIYSRLSKTSQRLFKKNILRLELLIYSQDQFKQHKVKCNNGYRKYMVIYLSSRSEISMDTVFLNK